jgi:hypothetical protein
MVYRLSTGADSGKKQLFSAMGMTLFMTIGLPIVGALLTATDLTKSPTAVAQDTSHQKGAVLGASTQVAVPEPNTSRSSDPAPAPKVNNSAQSKTSAKKTAIPANPTNNAQTEQISTPPVAEVMPPAPELPPTQPPADPQPPVNPPVDPPIIDPSIILN